MQLLNYVQHCFDDGSIAWATFYGLKEAFDYMSHSLLMQKLCRYNFDLKSTKFINCYPSNRRQYVSIQGQCSNVWKLEHGVLQGSVIDPTLFIIFINDLTACDLSHRTLLYDADTTIVGSGKDINVTCSVGKYRNNVLLKICNVFVERVSIHLCKQTSTLKP
nr:unnamed protein product [Callosobruchus analis]